jgi:predicted nucleic acid-binding protein
VSKSKHPIKVGSLAVDTSAVVSLFRGDKEALARFNRAEEVWMPVTALGELYCGLRKCNNPEKERLRINDMRERCLVVGIDEGTAIRHQMPLLAKDGHFNHVEGLDLIAL